MQEQPTQPQGYLLINKPEGITSHDVVDCVRKVTGIRKVGHAGTLDPFATGLLIIAVSRGATKHIAEFVGQPKVYKATFLLGASSNTDDLTGELTSTPLTKPITEETLDKALEPFQGQIEQLPPAFSAIKIKGRKMYEAARKGEILEAKHRTVIIYDIARIGSVKTNEDNTQEFDIRIHCSSGTYIRAIARDLGKNLGGGGYVKTLHREMIGPFKDEEALELDQFEKKTNDWKELLRDVEEMQKSLEN